MFKNIQHRLNPNFGSVISSSGVVVTEETSKVSLVNDAGEQSLPVPPPLEVLDDIVYPPITEKEVEVPKTLNVPTLFADWFCFDFNRTAPLFELFRWGDCMYHQLDASELVDELMREPSFIDNEFHAYYSGNCLYLGYTGFGVKQISNFGWTALSEIPYKAGDSSPTNYSADKYFELVSFRAVVAPSDVSIADKVNEQLTTSMYTIDFLNHEPILESFIGDGETYENIRADNLNNALQGSSSWTESGMLASFDNGVLTITNESTLDKDVGTFAWRCANECRYIEKLFASDKYDTGISYSNVLFTAKVVHKGEDVVAIRDYNDGAGIWYRLVAIKDLSNKAITFTNATAWMLPKDMFLQYKDIDGEMLWVLSGELPDLAIEIELAYINDTNILLPEFLNAGESVRLTLPNKERTVDFPLTDLANVKSIIIQSINQ